MLITRKGYEKIVSDYKKLVEVDRPECSKWIEESRTMGSLEDNPEFMTAMAKQMEINKKIEQLGEVINNATIFNRDMVDDNVVGFGATVSLQNLENGKKIKYTIVSIYESDVSNGYISIEAPFIKSIIGLRKGDIFDFNDEEYEITDLSF